MFDNKQVKNWIAVNGKHVPIFEDTKDRDDVNRAIAKSNEEKRLSEIAKNKEQADKLNGVAIRKMTLDNLNYEKKKWDKRKSPYANRNRELDNLDSGLAFIDENFGDVRDLIGTVYIRNISGYPGLYDRQGYQGKGRATFFSGADHIGEDTIIHEFTHAITDEIASHYKELGFNSEREVFEAMRREVLESLGEVADRKYDGRKWADRPQEFLSYNVEHFGHNRQGKREWDAVSTGREYKSSVSPRAKRTLEIIKKWWKKIGR